jgi:putative hemolysin
MPNVRTHTKIKTSVSRQINLLKLFRARRRFEVSDERYTVRLARTRREVESALALRYKVFKAEIGREDSSPGQPQIEFDEFDFKCSHLIVIERATGTTVGTYRIMSFEKASSPFGFYSSNEFTIEDLPREVLASGMEIGRACIAPEHRNTKVLFLMWKTLARYLELTGKRYFFGCCSIFSTEPTVGQTAMSQLVADGHTHKSIQVKPRANGIDIVDEPDFDAIATQLPPLFNMYLRIGAKVCGPPMIDHAFGTIDFFVVFDLTEMTPKYRKMFFDRG